MFSLICVWINDWVNNREAGDLRRHRPHYDVIVMRGNHFSTLNRILNSLTQIRVSKLILNGSDNGLSPGRYQAITWSNAGILLMGPLGTNFNGFLIVIQKFSFKKIHLKKTAAKMAAILSWPQCVKSHYCLWLMLVLKFMLCSRRCFDVINLLTLSC